MSIPSPFHLHILLLPIIFVSALPLFLLASFTTFCAFIILSFRLLTIYIELALAVIPHWLFGLALTPQSLAAQKNNLLAQHRAGGTPPGTGRRRHGRRGSSSSTLSLSMKSPQIGGPSGSSGVVTPTSARITSTNHLHEFIPTSLGATRDYEGVGGWRLGGNSDDEDDTNTPWNSRLELPAEQYVRRHQLVQRSITADTVGTIRGSGEGKRSHSPPENVVMNTSRSRARTPSGSAGTMGMGIDGYFPNPSPVRTGKSSRTGSGSSGSGERRGSLKVS